jgi:excisionase family DNA binding protein
VKTPLLLPDWIVEKLAKIAAESRCFLVHASVLRSDFYEKVKQQSPRGFDSLHAAALIFCAYDWPKIADCFQEATTAAGLSSKTLWNKIRTGKLRSLRVGTRVLILKSDLIGWLQSLADNSGKIVRADRSKFLTQQNRLRAEAKK